MRVGPWRRTSDIVVVAVDIAVAAAVCAIAYRLRFEGDPVPGRYVARYQGVSVGVCVAWAFAARASGLSRRAALRPGTRNLEQSFEGALVLGAALLIVNYGGISGDLSRAWIGLVTFGLVLGGIASRGVLRHARRALSPFGFGLERYAVVGEDDSARRLLADLTRAPGAPFRVVGTVPAASDPEGLVRLA
ncbi:MAG TPA: hypothetical protein VHE83_05865, partial [Mycobacteriales bacterium]|nr:hypothetical protein [Mycobacteriales bacterium]